MRPVQIYRVPPLPPGMCFKCRSGDTTRDFFVDLGFDTDYEGTVYLCNECVTDIGRLSAIFMTNEAHNQVVAQLDTEMAILREANEKYEDYQSAFFKLTGNNLNDFFESLDVIENGPRTSPGDDSTIATITPEPDKYPIHTKSDDLPTDNTDPPILIIPTFA